MEEPETILYKCTGCDVLFPSMSDVENHICSPPSQAASADAPPPMNLYKCSACDSIYNNLAMFNSHLCASQSQQSFQMSSSYQQSDDALHMQTFSVSDDTYDQNQMVYEQNEPSIVLGQILKTEEEESNSTAEMNETGEQYQKVMVAANHDEHYLVQNNGVPAPEGRQQQSVNQATVRGENQIPIKQELVFTQQMVWKEEPVVCPVCGVLCASRTQLLRHRKKEHHSQRLVSCYLCDRFFENEASLAAHQRLLHSRRWRHRAASDNISTSAKPIGKLDEELHRASVKAFGVSVNAPMYRCSACIASFPDAAELREHEECIHSLSAAAMFQCRHCNKSCSSRADLQRHRQRNHTRPNSFICDEVNCRKTFATRLALEFHIRDHLGLYLESCRKSYQCGWCPRRFWQRIQLRRHQSLHGQCPQICPWCQGSFVERRALRRHCRRMHSARHKCLYCPQTFLSPGQLTRHVNKEHPPDDSLPEDPAEQYPNEGHVRADTAFYYCTKCLDIFTSHRDLLEHHRCSAGKHAQTCVPCGGITFATSHDYSRHQNSKHSTRRVPRDPAKLWNGQPRPRRLPADPKNALICNQCGLEFRNKKGLGIHMGRAHPSPLYQKTPRKVEKKPTRPPVQLPLKTELPSTATEACVISVSQEGNPIPITASDKVPYTRILKVMERNDDDAADGTMRTSRKKQLHTYIYQLRNHIQDGLGIVMPSHTLPDKDRSYASYFEDILNLPPVQACLSDMEAVAGGCRVTFSLPFPHNLVAMVWVNFLMSFEPPGSTPSQQGHSEYGQGEA